MSIRDSLSENVLAGVSSVQLAGQAHRSLSVWCSFGGGGEREAAPASTFTTTQSTGALHTFPFKDSSSSGIGVAAHVFCVT